MRFFQITNGSLGEHAYLIGASDTKDCVIVDPGMPKPVLDALEKEGLNCVAILLTHGHFDHIGGVRQIKERYGAKVYIHELDAGMLTSNRLSLAVLTGDLVKPSAADVLLQGGETLKQERKLLVGDTLFLEGAGRTDFPGGNERELYHSIADKLFTLEGDFDVYCGHEEDTTLEHERKNNPFVEVCRRSGW